MTIQAIDTIINLFTAYYNDDYDDADLSFTIIIRADQLYSLDDCTPEDIDVNKGGKFLIFGKEFCTDPQIFIDTDTITSIQFYAIENEKK